MERCLFIVRFVFYCILWFLAWMIFVPLSITYDEYQGYCLLYADAIAFGPVSVCGYIISVTILCNLMYAGYMGVACCCKTAVYSSTGIIDETFVEFVITVAFDGLSWAFMFVTASMLSAGFNEMCWNIFGSLRRCEEGVLVHPVFGNDDRFFVHIKMAEVSAWLSWLLWLCQFVLGVVALWRSGVKDKPPGPAEPSSPFCFGAVPCRPQCVCDCGLKMIKNPDDDGVPVTLGGAAAKNQMPPKTQQAATRLV